MHVYLDNAATTALDKEVLEAMMPFLTDNFGNPSSIHAHGTRVRSAIEKARKSIAKILNTSPSEIFFTSGGTESDNMAIRCSLSSHQIRHAVTSHLEHHAVLHTLEELAKKGEIELSFVETDQKGNVILESLENILAQKPRSLVSLMYANNEIGNILDVEEVGNICEKYNAVFHSDCVQAVGHFHLDLQKLKIHSLAGAAHKFHGPKGVGLMYIRHDLKIPAMITGGAQERNMRGGTENVYGIVGLAKAMEIAYRDLEVHQKHILALKKYFIEKLQANFEDIRFNGESADLEKSLYTVLNVSFPPSKIKDMLLFSLDINQISVSGGSACSSGSNVGSHVLAALNADAERSSVRFSFSKYNTFEEIDYTIEKLIHLFEPQLVRK